MVEFKDIANNAWSGIQEISKTSSVDITSFRNKRQGYGEGYNAAGTAPPATAPVQGGYGAQAVTNTVSSSGGCSKRILLIFSIP